MRYRGGSTRPSRAGWVARVAISTGLLLLACASALAQGGLASINGTVTDQSGAVVARARVVATDNATGQSRETTTAENGTYVIPLLPVGVYSVTCSQTGFKSVTHVDVTLQADEKATVDFSLAVGQTVQTVEVSASAERLNTTNGTIGQIVSEKDIVELPLNGRNPAELVFLAPGATDGMKDQVFTRQDFTSFPTETGASVNGGRQGSTFYMLDGSNSMDNYENLASPMPNSDATQEFQVLTNNFDAQYGFSPGAVVSIVTKSGSNSWHGDAFDFVRNDALNARDPFALVKDPLKRNQFGASAGGKIIADKLFIFGNYQGTIEHRVVNSGSAYVPTTQMLSGDYSEFLTGTKMNLCGTGGPANLNFDTGQVFDEKTAANFTCPAGSQYAGKNVVVKQPFANNLINPALYNAVSMKFENETLPQPTDPAGCGAPAVNNCGFTIVPGRVALQNFKEFTIKPDWYMSEKSHISGRVFWDKFSHPLESGGGDILIADRSWDTDFRNYGGNWVYTIHPNLINNVVVGYNETLANSVPGLRTKDGKPVSYSSFGVNVSDYPSTPPGIDELATSGFFVGQNTNIINRHNVSLGDTVTWTKGKHLVVAGVNVLDQTWDEATDWLALPLISFGNQFSSVADAAGNQIGASPASFADFLLGDANGFEQGAGEFNHVHGISWAGFGQDTIRLKPNLTIMGGVRWEPFFPYTPSKGRIGLWRPGLQSTVYPNAPVGLAYPGDPGVPATSGIQNELGIISPRLSVAWQPKALPNTSVRAAFGIFAAPFEFSFYNHAADTAPFSPTFSFGPTTTGGPAVPGGTPIPFQDPYSVWVPVTGTGTAGQSPFPPFASANYKPPSSTTFILPVQVQDGFARDFKLGKVQQWNVSIEREFRGDILLRAAYVGSEAYDLPLPLENNPGLYNADPSLFGVRGNANFSSVLDYTSVGTASYNALQLTFDKKFSHGLQFTSNYAFSKNLDEGSSASLAFNGSVPDPANIRFNRGKSNLDFTHIWTSYGVWELPKLAGQTKLVQQVLGSWELTGIWHLQSGLPFGIGGGGPQGGNDSGSDIYGDRADLTGQPLGIKKGTKTQWLHQYFNPAAFQPNALGTFGDSPRNLIVGPHLDRIDMGVDKNFPFKERYRIQFRWELFNATNTPAYNYPNTSFVGSGAGSITCTWGCASGVDADAYGYQPRVMQVALKFYW